MTIPAHEQFDVQGFWTDVEKDLIKRGISKDLFANAYVSIDPSWFKKAMRERLSPSLRIACLLVKSCGLSLDDYVR